MGFPNLDDRLDAAGPCGHDGDAVGEEHRFGEAVRHEDDRLAGLGEQDRQIFAEHHAGLLVERGERLVHQEDVGADAETARQIDALAHADGKLGRIMSGKARHADGVAAQRARGRPIRPSASPLNFSATRKFSSIVIPGKERAFLEDEGDLGGQRRAVHRAAADRDAAGGGLEEAADDVEQRALAAARRTEQADEFAAADVERNVVERQHGIVRIGFAVALANVADRNRDRALAAARAGSRPALQRRLVRRGENFRSAKRRSRFWCDAARLYNFTGTNCGSYRASRAGSVSVMPRSFSEARITSSAFGGKAPSKDSILISSS